MATTDTSLLGELLKRMYPVQEIQQLLNLMSPCLANCAREWSGAKVAGTGMRFSVRTETAGGIGYIDEVGDFPQRRQTQVLQANVDPTVFIGTFEISGLANAVSTGDAAAFAQAYDEQAEGTMGEMTAYKEGALFRDGSGLLATFVTDVTSVGTGPFTVSDVGFFREGQYVDIIDASATTRHDTRNKITAVDWVNDQLSFNDGVPTAVDANDRIFLADSQDTSGALVNREPIGLDGAIDSSGTYLGIDRDATANWRSSEITVSDFLDEDVIQRARTRIQQESGATINLMAGRFGAVMHQMQADQLFRESIPRIRYSGTSNNDLLNSANPNIGGMPIYVSHQCPPSKAWIGDWQHFRTVYTPNGKMQIDTEKNGSPIKWVATKDVGLSYFREYAAFVCKSPIHFCKLQSITERSR